MKVLNKEELYDILYGATILGTGGGGELSKGLRLIDDALKQGKEFKLIDFNEIGDEDLIATPYYCGAISPETEEIKKKYEGLPRLTDIPHLKALKEIEAFFKKEIKGIISTELGGGNTGIALYTAAMANKYILDGDPAGRSVPELQHSTYYLKGVSIEPLAVCNEFGESAIFTDIANDFRAEKLIRALAVESKNSIAVIDHVHPNRIIKKSVIKGAISYAMKIGNAFRNAKKIGKSVSNAVIDAGSGIKLFEGIVEKNNWDTVDGFTIGETIIKSEKEEYKIWYKNENIVSWKNGTFDVTVPDLICIMDLENEMPVINPSIRVGSHVVIYALPAPEEWKTKKGIELFGPKSFGFSTNVLTPFE